MTSQQFSFDVEVGKVLSLMINSLYTNKDVSLRELISNAADACDKLRYLAIQDANLLSENEELKITISVDKSAKLLIISDNGIGMSKEDLITHLGTIARSGTESFIKSLSGDKVKDVQLIGQFGVGFYSAFMIANQVEVISKKYDQTESYKWQSSGSDNFTIDKYEASFNRGTKIILHLKDDAREFLDRFHIKHVVQTYSDNIDVKIEFINDDGQSEILNSASAIWARPKDQITKEQYQAFFKHIAHIPGDIFMTLHNKIEGVIEYINLLFIPANKPFDLFHPDRRTSIKLYVKKVFISEDLNLVPAYLRFVRGIVDCNSLPLNISRETLQHNIVVERIKNSLVKKILSELQKKSSENEEEYIKFWNNFGAVLKEGLCESSEFREKILEICRFYSSKSPNKLISLQDYLNNAKPGQDKIYYLSGESIEKIKSSPQLEIFLAKDVEVLFLTDAVDDFWVTVAIPYKEKEFQSVTRHDINLENLDQDPKQKDEQEKDEQKSETDSKIKDVTASAFEGLLNFIKEVLKDKIKDVRISKKLTNSPVCLAVDANSMDIRMERYLLEQNQILSSSAKILEINPNNKIIISLNEKLALAENKQENQETIRTLFDIACIIEGEPIADAKDFSLRIEKLL